MYKILLSILATSVLVSCGQTQWKKDGVSHWQHEDGRVVRRMTFDEMCSAYPHFKVCNPGEIIEIQNTKNQGLQDGYRQGVWFEEGPDGGGSGSSGGGDAGSVSGPGPGAVGGASPGVSPGSSGGGNNGGGSVSGGGGGSGGDSGNSASSSDDGGISAASIAPDPNNDEPGDPGENRGDTGGGAGNGGGSGGNGCHR